MNKELFRERVPLLRDVPDEIFKCLDTAEFHLPDEDLIRVRTEMENLLGVYIMTYNALVFNLNCPLESHLCANVKGAVLSADQLKILQDYEERVHTRGISFVAYQKPLEIIDPRESPMASLYQDVLDSV